MKRTAAHWGSWIVKGSGAGLRLEPDPEDPSPSRIGRGWLSAAKDARVRIARPAVRQGWLEGDGGSKRCDDRFVEVPWERALELTAAELERVRSTHGNEAIFAGSYGWASAGRFHHAQSQMRRFLNLIGGHTDKRDTYSHAAAEVLFPWILGWSNAEVINRMTTWPLIEKHCTLMLAFGGISSRTSQIASGGISRHIVPGWVGRLADAGIEIINVSPQNSDLSAAGAAAAQWVPIRPGTDSALILGICHELLVNNLHDEEFLERCTSGWKEFKSYLLGESGGAARTAQWAAGVSDVPVDWIRRLARRLPREKVMINAVMSLQRADHGEQPIWAALALAAMLGQIGQPGTGFGFGYGSSASVGRPDRIIGWPSLPRVPNPVDRFIPVARIADMLLSPGDECLYNGQKCRYPDTRLVYWAGGNPFHHHQDLNRLQKAWQRPETVVVHDHSWTATARRADIVLPCTTPLEREDLAIVPKDPALIYMSRVLDRFAESRDDFDIFSDLASRLGVEQQFTEGLSAAEWIRRLWDDCRCTADNLGFELPNFDDFRRAGRFDLPHTYEDRVLMDEFVKNPLSSPLATESGRITLFNRSMADLGLDDCPGHPAWLEPAEWLGDADADEFHLISAMPDNRLHSQLDNGSESRSGKLAGREPCTLHPDAAGRLKLQEGDVVRIWNRRGACLSALRLRDDIRPDCIALANGAWFDPQTVEGADIEVHGNPNVLTIDKGCSSLSQGNIGHTALVRVEKWHGPLPEVLVMKPPPFA